MGGGKARGNPHGEKMMREGETTVCTGPVSAPNVGAPGQLGSGGPAPGPHPCSGSRCRAPFPACDSAVRWADAGESSVSTAERGTEVGR